MKIQCLYFEYDVLVSNLCENIDMSGKWVEREHKVWLKENTEEVGSYKCELICDGKTVYAMEKNVTTRMQLLTVHEDMLSVAHHYMETGELPSLSKRRGIKKYGN